MKRYFHPNDVEQHDLGDLVFYSDALAAIETARQEERERLLDVFRHERDTSDGVVHVAANWAIGKIHTTAPTGDENE